MKRQRRAFTLIELMVVILIVSVLAAVSIPLMKARIDRGKWTEANAAAGMIRNAVKTKYFEDGVTVSGNMGQPENQSALKIQEGDLRGTYFVASDYEIVSVNENGIAVIKVTGSRDNAPSGSRTLSPSGAFEAATGEEDSGTHTEE